MSKLDILVGYYELLCVMFSDNPSEEQKEELRKSIKKTREEINKCLMSEEFH